MAGGTKEWRGTALKERMAEAFNALSSKEASELYSSIREESVKRGFTYERHGVIEPINLMLVPTFFSSPQVKYLTRVAHSVKRGVDALYRERPSDIELRKVLPFTEEEESFMLSVKSPPVEEGEAIWYRLDSHFHMRDESWMDKVSIFEINSSAVGGIHYGPASESIFFDIILPVIRKHIKDLPPLKKSPDLRDIFSSLLERHARAVGRKTLNIAFVEDTTVREGITEGPSIVEYLKRKGRKIVLADPRELHVKDEEVCYKDTPLDIVYRNLEVRDIIEMERAGDDVRAMRLAFAKNIVVSSLAGELDHKSVLEALSSGAFDRYFSAEDSSVFKKHLLWTRTLCERMTGGPEGFEVDLVPYTLKNKDSLVIKPNRECGGYGVSIGHDMKTSDWEALVERAVREGRGEGGEGGVGAEGAEAEGGEAGGWVVQRFGSPEEFVFPLFDGGKLEFEKHNIVYGLSSAPDGTGILGRVSRQDVVNVAQQGGLMPVLSID